MASVTAPTFDWANARSLSKSKLLEFQWGFSKTSSPKYVRPRLPPFPAATRFFHSSSLPRAHPGKIEAPVRGCFGPRYSRVNAATWAAVRQESLSDDLHSSDSGLNEQRLGSSIR